jgi:hypothetical protein
MRLPKPIVDLYRDLRDRRLLLPGLALVIALVAVPALLSKSSSGSAGVPSGGSAASSAPTAAQPAVVAENIGVRDGKRLSTLTRKDPFKRHFSLPKLPGGNPGKLAPPTGTTTSTTPAATSSLPPATIPPATTPPSTTATPATPPPSQGTTTTSGSSPPTHPTKPGLYHAVVDLKIGQPDNLKRRNGVGALTELPHRSNPVVALLGATLDRTKAEFVVSQSVTSVQGGSSCAPRRSQCQLLVMKPGGKAKLRDSASGKTWVLRVLAIRLVRVHGGQGGSGGGSRKESSGGGAWGGDAAGFGSGVAR